MKTVKLKSRSLGMSMLVQNALNGEWVEIALLGLPPSGGGEFEWTSAYVLVSDGQKVGVGSYDFDREVWTYEMTGENEQDDNEITHWASLPAPPRGIAP